MPKSEHQTYAIFSLGDRQGTSSSSSSSLSSPSSPASWLMLRVEFVNMSGTGSILGLLEFLRWFITSGLSRLGFSPALGMSRWLPAIDISIVVEPGEDSFRHCLESLSPVLSGNVAGENYTVNNRKCVLENSDVTHNMVGNPFNGLAQKFTEIIEKTEIK